MKPDVILASPNEVEFECELLGVDDSDERVMAFSPEDAARRFMSDTDESGMSDIVVFNTETGERCCVRCFVDVVVSRTVMRLPFDESRGDALPCEP